MKLSRLDPDKQIAAGTIITVCGKRNTGTSLITRHLMSVLRDKIEFAICMTPTQSSADAFRQCMPHGLVYDQGLDLGVIERLMAYQSECAAKGKRDMSS